ncbi:hypothetical protein VHUM_00524 [Vanrija humicola]|uniref:Alpha/beta hydrolase fold-3 domain-containing protein n=1 Tax=Vanrija humicola TaxID=5417 RepID=A0A7D8Z1I3_VANHU|nr:hypothetical protein VHUM_00524 [Vanrija humicola]
MSPFSTGNVVLMATPTVLSATVEHCASWPARHAKPKDAEALTGSPVGIKDLPVNQLRYEAGVKVIRRFLDYSMAHPIEEVQSFSGQEVPDSRGWHKEWVGIPEANIERAADLVAEHLRTYTPDGDLVKLVGGDKWWRVRGHELEAEWLEVASNSGSSRRGGSVARRSWHGVEHLFHRPHKPVKDGSGADVSRDRVLFYVHGGAFFFSSVQLHRYQIQKHAKKAGARAFTPNYRLAPQYPFPCALLDALAAYLYLIDPPPDSSQAPVAPSSIIMMGDSAGANIIVALLVLMRETGVPLPAAANLVSAWCDLAHTMPSINEWGGGDHIINVGFHFKPSLVWPPLPGNGITVTDESGEKIFIDEQIHQYCTNTLITHPLVSIINSGSLGGLCPLYFSAGGAELLRDEIIYLAHKAANPSKYPPSRHTLAEYPNLADQIDKYPPTHVVLQVFEGACHVAPTLAWTRTARLIFRGGADFNIWAYKHAAKKKLDASPQGIHDALCEELASPPRSATSEAFRDLPVPVATGMQRVASSPAMSSSSSASALSSSEPAPKEHQRFVVVEGTHPKWAGGTIIAERVSAHGVISAFEPASQVAALNPALRDGIGYIGPRGPIQNWINKRKEWDERWPKELAEFHEVREKDWARASTTGFLTRALQGEEPPRCALAALSDFELAYKVAKSVDAPSGKGKHAVAMWARLAEHNGHEAGEAEVVEHKVKKGRRSRKGSLSSLMKREREAARSGSEEETRPDPTPLQRPVLQIAVA